MRGMFLFVLVLAVCPLAQLLGLVGLPAAPVPTPAVSAPYVEISADATNISVGDTLTITGVPFNIGLPYYTVVISSGATVTITYDGQVTTEPGDGTLAKDEQFEIVSAQAELNRVTFVLRALAPGTVEAIISATGEVRSLDGAFMWSGGTSQPLTLSVD